MTRWSLRSRIASLTVLALAASASLALAGPPLLCHPYDIGTARSLPWDAANGWMGRAAAVNLQTLVDDTEALLTPTTPVIVRMETLRRAGIYASRDERVAERLLTRLLARARDAEKGGKADPLASFDAGYLIETYRQIAAMQGWGEKELQARTAAVGTLVKGLDGYAMVEKSLAARPGDASIEFAAALIAVSHNRRDLYAQHSVKARAGGPQDALLARNLGQISGS